MRNIVLAGLTVVLLMFFGSQLLAQSCVFDERVKQKGERHRSRDLVQDVKLKKVEPFKYCALEMIGSYDRHEEAFKTLFAESSKQGIRMQGIMFGIYYSDPKKTPVDELKWEVGFSISGREKVRAPLIVKDWKFDRVASLTYEGEFSEEKMARVYSSIYNWIFGNGYVPSGPPMECYLDAPRKNESGFLVGKIEVMIPVEDKNQSGE